MMDCVVLSCCNLLMDDDRMTPKTPQVPSRSAFHVEASTVGPQVMKLFIQKDRQWDSGTCAEVTQVVVLPL